MTAELQFRDRVALIAGGTGALGRSVSAVFAREGARVIVTYRRQSEFEEFLSQSKLNARDVKGLIVDATDASAVARAIESILANGGALDILVNTIGGYHGGKRMLEGALSTFEQRVSFDFKAGFYLPPPRLPPTHPPHPR